MNYCDVSVTLSWKKTTVIKSHDLIGGYFESTNTIYSSSAILSYANKSVSPIENIVKNNALSSTFKIPSTNELIIVMQKYRVNKGGELYVSYQHAKANVTLEQSRKYNFSSNGYGGVFNFDSSIASKYDGMKGLSINLG